MILSLKQAFLKPDFKDELDLTLDLSDSSDGDIFKSPINISGTVRNSAGTVLLTADINTVLHSVCARCLDDVAIPFKGSFSHIIVEALSNEENDADFVVAENGELDLSELVRSDLLLNLPSRILCDESCKGLCQLCGVNLNRIKCDCKPEQLNSNRKLAGLNELLNK